MDTYDDVDETTTANINIEKIYTHFVVCMGTAHIHTLVFILVVEELASGSYKLAEFFAGMLAVNPFVFPGIYRSKVIKEIVYDLVTQVFYDL